MKKALKIVGGIILILIVLIILCGIFLVNREDATYKSHYAYVDASELKGKIRKEGKSAIVIISSPTCPGHPEYLPKIAKQQEFITLKEIEVYFVMDMINKEENDSLLTRHSKEYNITYTPLVMDPTKYPSGNLFDLENKYDTFLTELCGSCNDGSLGYPQYFYYKDGQYVGKSYYLDKSLLASLN